MGAYAPAPVVTPEILEQVKKDIIRPTIDAMAAEGKIYRGVLYCGLMLTAEGPKVVEFNCRFGDPECQAIMPLIRNDVVDIFMAVCEGKLKNCALELHSLSAVCVVMASGGYPDSYEKNKKISGLSTIADKSTVVFHAGTEKRGQDFFTSGGRVLGVTAFSEDLNDAATRAYRATEKIHFEQAYFRKDIGHRALKK
jgi:phosphoribosylamine--glycine ligase